MVKVFKRYRLKTVKNWPFLILNIFQQIGLKLALFDLFKKFLSRLEILLLILVENLIFYKTSLCKKFINLRTTKMVLRRPTFFPKFFNIIFNLFIKIIRHLNDVWKICLKKIFCILKLYRCFCSLKRRIILKLISVI